MAEGEGGGAQNQASRNTQPSNQNQDQQSQSQSSTRGRSRGGNRRGRGGRGRGGQTNGSSRGGRNAPSDRDASAPAPAPTAQPQADSAPESSGIQRGRRNRHGQRGQRGQRQGVRGAGNTVVGGRTGPQRQFGGHLTTDVDETSSVAELLENPSLSADAPEFVPGQPVAPRNNPPTQARSRRKQHKKPHKEVPKSTAPELWKRIHEDINNYNYDCSVCMDYVTRDSPVWSCSICYTVLHLSCVKTWFASAKKADESQGGVTHWRCPGCNSGLIEEPGDYHCWCDKEKEPRSVSSVLPPHSCGQTCSKPRSTCPHPCSLQCHAGPCPPCDVLAPPEPCYCGKQTVRKLCRETDYENGWSCQDPCADLLPCGEHVCPQLCHPGICGDCRVPVEVTCFCGSVHKEVPCFRREDPRDSYSITKQEWFLGEFYCGSVCAREYDCGIHKCPERCHPQDEIAAHCPLTPDVVSKCPCGKTPLDELMDHPRQSCTDEVPHCEKRCDKLLSCGHFCDSKCHIDDCPPCQQMMEIDCRCGRVKSETLCHQGDISQPWCLKVCQANKSCGRHRCGQHCCPGDKRAQGRASQKKNRNEPAPVEAEHICLQTCGRPLKCGSHTCQARCHRGPCPSCPEAIFHEISCNCGQTVLQPPLACGTRPPSCTAQCRRGRPCGHPQVDHRCHEDDVSCPPCPYLCEKTCACGKKNLPHVPCHLQEPHCGQVCGQKLKCGLHLCKKLCHRPGQCKDAEEGCEQVCGKKKLLCEHVCQNVCHGQNPCNESTACPVKMIKTCPCGHYKKEVKCSVSTSNPSPSRSELRCDEECSRLDRNRRLAEALNIDASSHTDDHVPYSDATLKLYNDHPNWSDAQERQFRVFANSRDEVRIRYKPMKQPQRRFLHVLAQDFGLSSRSEDQEPYRYVVIYKTDKFVGPPVKTLAQCVKIRAEQAAAAAAATAATTPAREASPAPTEITEPFNSFLLTAHRFGLTSEEITTAIQPDLDTVPSFHFAIEFLPHDEVLIKATANYAAFLAAPIDQVLGNLKPRLEQSVVQQHKLAANVLLCHTDPQSGEVTRRENLRRPGAGGWSAVAGRAATKKPSTPVEEGSAAGKKLLGLRKKKVEPQKTWASLEGDVEC